MLRFCVESNVIKHLVFCESESTHCFAKVNISNEGKFATDIYIEMPIKTFYQSHRIYVTVCLDKFHFLGYSMA